VIHGIQKELPSMALGVLNNLSAIYAENNLNNTNSSLQKVLQQLSSGSRINSGADDAAGLSLVNGLGANSAALTQSETNATEGVGLLQVADGALSQVTTLLDRAITLATEASNGTLNSTQDSAANQEYQSILSEINNIGQTTTYNQEQVFNGTETAIYTGDSSQAGSSSDNLYIRSLSESSVGDTSGSMDYSSGEGNVFIDLSKNGTDAKVTDALASATTTIDVSYLTQGAQGTQVSPATISVGAGTANPSDTVQGLINAINNAGLGLSASLTTGSAAGDTVAGTDTGIEITGAGAGVGNGTAPGEIGTVAIGGGGAAADLLTGTLTIKGNNGVVHNITLSAANNNDTLDLLKAAINAAGYGVTAAVNGTTLTLTSTDSAVTASATGLTDTTDNTATVNYAAASSYYTTGVTDSGGGTTVEDSATNQVATANYTADPNGTGGIATIGYSDGSGESLSGTDLLNQADAQAALNDLNVAITDVAAMDGYIGAQINTLNSISQVMSTQQENVISAQNAIQATDYASATSNMSKYEILSQTGIAALAQANSVEQEVTKLLQ
jgi:flagellin